MSHFNSCHKLEYISWNSFFFSIIQLVKGFLSGPFTHILYSWSLEKAQNNDRSRSSCKVSHSSLQ